jgi:hypothetical protein
VIGEAAIGQTLPSLIVVQSATASARRRPPARVGTTPCPCEGTLPYVACPGKGCRG